MNPRHPQKRRAPIADIYARFSSQPPRVKPVRHNPTALRVTPAQAARVAEVRDNLLDDLMAAGASAEVMEVILRHFERIAEISAEAAAKQAMAEAARQRLMGALRFAVGVNPEGTTMLRAEQDRKLEEIAELQRLNSEKDEQLQLLSNGQSGRFFKSLGDSIVKDTRDLMNRLDRYEAVLTAPDSPQLARNVVNSLRNLCDNLGEFGENALAYSGD